MICNYNYDAFNREAGKKKIPSEEEEKKSLPAVLSFDASVRLNFSIFFSSLLLKKRRKILLHWNFCSFNSVTERSLLLLFCTSKNTFFLFSSFHWTTHVLWLWLPSSSSLSQYISLSYTRQQHDVIRVSAGIPFLPLTPVFFINLKGCLFLDDSLSCFWLPLFFSLFLCSLQKKTFSRANEMMIRFETRSSLLSLAFIHSLLCTLLLFFTLSMCSYCCACRSWAGEMCFARWVRKRRTTEFSWLSSLPLLSLLSFKRKEREREILVQKQREGTREGIENQWRHIPFLNCFWMKEREKTVVEDDF